MVLQVFISMFTWVFVFLCGETVTWLKFPHSCNVLDYGKPAVEGVIPPRSPSRRLSPSEGQRASSRNRDKLFRITLNTTTPGSCSMMTNGVLLRVIRSAHRCQDGETHLCFCARNLLIVTHLC